MGNKEVVLVVGTTPDYIDWIRKTSHNKTLFITDPDLRHKASEPLPNDYEEILCDLNNDEKVKNLLSNHLQKWGLYIKGVACFDCESMAITASIAQDFNLSYPTIEAINNCRDKYISKRIWQQKGVPAPKIQKVANEKDVCTFFNELDYKECVLKPCSGSGSELVFKCKTQNECISSFNKIQQGLANRKEERLYKKISVNSSLIIAEEFIDAQEWSCDFIIQDNFLQIIRLCKKIPSVNGPFGTIMGYVLSDTLFEKIDMQHFCDYMKDAAQTLGIERAICMVDFMVKDNEIIMLELTPRPGGDCIPFLLKQAFNLDIIALALDFAQHKKVRFNSYNIENQYVGLRIHARQGGIIKNIDYSAIAQDLRIKQIYIKRQTGDIITMPPYDYESFLMGHIIFIPFDKDQIIDECIQLLNSLNVEIAPL